MLQCRTPKLQLRGERESIIVFPFPIKEVENISFSVVERKKKFIALLPYYICVLSCSPLYKAAVLCKAHDLLLLLKLQCPTPKETCYHPFLEGIGKFLGFEFGLFQNDFLQKLFPSICIFTKIVCALFF